MEGCKKSGEVMEGESEHVQVGDHRHASWILEAPTFKKTCAA